MAKKEYDFVILGSGLSALLVAQTLRKSHKSFKIIDSTELLGGHLRAPDAPLTIERSLKLFWKDDLTIEALDYLNSTFLDLNLETETRELPPITFDKGHFQPFVGFGKKQPKYSDQIDRYTLSDRIFLNHGPITWLTELTEGLEDFTILNAQNISITKTEDGGISIEYNRGKKLHCDRVIYTAPIENLSNYLCESELSPRLIQKIAKTPLWSSIGIDFIHSEQICDHETLNVLVGGTDSSEPCIGVFHPPVEVDGKLKQVSQWQGFVDKESGQDSDQAGHLLREIKKQVKRAYPQALKKVDFERILFSQNDHGFIETKVTNSITLPGFDRFHVVSGNSIAPGGIVGEILAVKRLLQIPEITSLLCDSAIQAEISCSPNPETLSGTHF